MTQSDIEIKTATHQQEFKDASELILEYVQWLGMDLSFQSFDAEMANLAQMYNPQDGGLFIAYLQGKPMGIAGLRRFSEHDAEVKRMYVKPESRNYGLGKLLLATCINKAQELNYKTVKLDTADYMTPAIKLYIDHGFVEIPAYRFNPYETARYFELKLT